MSHPIFSKRPFRLALLISLFMLVLLLLTLTNTFAATDSTPNSPLSLSSPQLTLTVNSTGDGHDSNTADNVCDDGTGNCTLRAAIEQANATTGADNITFNIKPSGAQTINVGLGGNGPLPTITQPVTIDGFTQGFCNGSPYSSSPCLELNGSQAGAGADGLTISAGSSVVRGLIINQFDGNGIRLTSTGGNIIDNNMIGTDFTGSIARPNHGAGILIDGSPKNLIGGTGYYYGSQHNILAGNDTGVWIRNSGARGNRVIGNWIGTIGQSGNSLGNTHDGVLISNGASNNKIGSADYYGNLIVNNGGVGVNVTSETRNRIRHNYIYRNRGLGIDLGGDGVDVNDKKDPDSGANNHQNYPVLHYNASTRNYHVVLNSTPNVTFKIEFFINAHCDPSGYGEGQSFYGQVSITTDSNGHASFDWPPVKPTPTPVPTKAPAGVAAGGGGGGGGSAPSGLTATATGPSGNTSEFSPCASPQ